MVQLNNIWKDRSIPTQLKMKILQCLVWPIMLYGCETWTTKKADVKTIEAAEMWFYRRLLRVKWTERRTNDSILQELGTNKQPCNHHQQKKTKIHWPCIKKQEHQPHENSPAGQNSVRKKEGQTTNLIYRRHEKLSRPEPAEYLPRQP